MRERERIKNRQRGRELDRKGRKRERVRVIGRERGTEPD